MPKINFQKIVFTIILFFVICLFGTSVFAKNIELNHKGRAIIHTESIDTKKQLSGVTVYFYQIATLNESFDFVPIKSGINLSATDKQLLSKAKELNISPQKHISKNGAVTFDNLSLGIYLVEIPDQKINKSTYGAEPFTVKIPISDTGGYSYLVEATPKISIQKSTNLKPVPRTSSQNYLETWVLLIIGFTLILAGIGIKRHGRRIRK
ncbi:hypothetical protein IIY59_01145 [Candidatus Saccharibacteria bacterium]|nr:hypothetical protein [Candidatus Saccharibacteria bacterium]